MKKAFFVATLALSSLLAREASATAFQIVNDAAGNEVSFVQYTLLGQAETGTMAGALDFTWSPTVPTGYSASFYAYCVDAEASLVSPESVTISSTNLLTTTKTPGFATNAGGKVAYLINTWAPIVNALTGSTQDTDAAALQVAIWEALYDNDSQATVSTSLSSGDFVLNSADPAVITQALAYLTDLYSGPGGAAKTSQATWLTVGAAGVGQSLIVAAPEPASVLLLGTGLFALAHGIRRRRRPSTRARGLRRTAPADAEAQSAT